MAHSLWYVLQMKQMKCNPVETHFFLLLLHSELSLVHVKVLQQGQALVLA